MIRALIVDDEAPARDRLRRLLDEIADVEVAGEAADGEQAMQEIARLTPDLVFLDIQMPALSGLDVAARLQPPRPRIVFCTAYDHFAIDAFELHAVDYLLKPVNRDRLVRTIDRIGGEIAEQRRHARDRDAAVQTQRRLMPADAPGGSGLDCAGACMPAEGVGGDYYDFLPLGPFRDNTRLGIALGDVSGKGLYAGLLAAALQARMQALTAREVQSPADLLLQLNRLTLGTIDANRFATVFFAAFDRAASTLTYANAGHPPAVVLSAGGHVRALDATGPAVGWSSDAQFEETALTLAPGDLFAAYSDGLSEAAAPDGRELGVDGIVDVLRRHALLPVRAIVAAVLEEVDRFTGGAPASDDRTLVVARVLDI
jgi:sigma-B regulation protein RsbU (phosphoserine phosphatase)